MNVAEEEDCIDLLSTSNLLIIKILVGGAEPKSQYSNRKNYLGRV
jgi:hypothetical protein